MIIRFVCNNPDCDNEISKFFHKHTDVPPFLECGACGTGKMERELSAPSTKSTIVVDNGYQSKSVELLTETVQNEFDRLEKENKKKK
jgi:hypothetical protein